MTQARQAMIRRSPAFDGINRPFAEPEPHFDSIDMSCDEPAPESTFEERMYGWLRQNLSLEVETETNYYDSDQRTHTIKLMLAGEEISQIKFDT
jgi:hypothetical protein